MDRRDFLTLSGGLATLAMLKSLPASAAGREGTLLVLVGDGPNSMDIHRTGTNRPSYQVAVNLYDRLVTFGSKQLEDGSVMYDYEDIRPELAESWEISDDGSVMTFKLRPDATFWDGSPVTAEDVKHAWNRGYRNVVKIVLILGRKLERKGTRPNGHRREAVPVAKIIRPIDLGFRILTIVDSTTSRSGTTADIELAGDDFDVREVITSVILAL